jgi:hypothetical protein
MAAAPFPINLTAPAFGASMAALALGFGSLTAAKKGDWNVSRRDSTTSTKTRWLLPAWAATGLRDMVEHGGSPSHRDPTKAAANGGDMHLHFAPTINHRSSSLKEELRTQSRDMRRWAGRQMRNGSIPMPSAA